MLWRVLAYHKHVDIHSIAQMEMCVRQRRVTRGRTPQLLAVGVQIPNDGNI
jgi:hypothetical protein